MKKSITKNKEGCGYMHVFINAEERLRLQIQSITVNPLAGYSRTVDKNGHSQEISSFHKHGCNLRGGAKGGGICPP